jgi:hypothetical protein
MWTHFIAKPGNQLLEGEGLSLEADARSAFNEVKVQDDHLFTRQLAEIARIWERRARTEETGDVEDIFEVEDYELWGGGVANIYYPPPAHLYLLHFL